MRNASWCGVQQLPHLISQISEARFLGPGRVLAFGQRGLELLDRSLSLCHRVLAPIQFGKPALEQVSKHSFRICSELALTLCHIAGKLLLFRRQLRFALRQVCRESAEIVVRLCHIRLASSARHAWNAATAASKRCCLSVS